MSKKLSLKVGDHLSSDRIIYTHHGLYVGNGKVIEYDRENGIQLTTLSGFVDGKFDCTVVEHPNRLYDREESVQRALSRLGECKYNLATNNCEHFVNWCIEGQASSAQVREVYTAIGNAILDCFGSKTSRQSGDTVSTVCSLLDSSLASQYVEDIDDSTVKSIALKKRLIK